MRRRSCFSPYTAAGQVCGGAVIIVALFRAKQSVDVSTVEKMKG